MKKHKSRIQIKNIDKARNYFLEGIEQNEMKSRKHKKICTTLNYIEHFLILASTITGCISISAFTSLLDISIRITSSVLGLKICTIAPGIKKYNSIITKKKHDKIVLLARSKLNSIEVLIDSDISHGKFGLINNVLKNMMIGKKK